jgi:hypothetical protein
MRPKTIGWDHHETLGGLGYRRALGSGRAEGWQMRPLQEKNFGLTHHRRKADMSKIAEIAYGFREDDLTPVILVAYGDGQVHAFTKLQPTGWVKAIPPEALDRTRPLDKSDFDRMFPGIDPLLIPPRENP